jgi:hypothetical protein
MRAPARRPDEVLAALSRGASASDALSAELETGRLHGEVPLGELSVQPSEDPPTAPLITTLNSTWVPPSGSGAHSWCADTVLPGCRCTQVKALPGSSAVTVYVPVGIRGWETSTREPTARGPASSGRTLLTESVHSGHRSTSTSTSHTRSGEAATSMFVRCSTPSIVAEIGIPQEGSTSPMVRHPRRPDMPAIRTVVPTLARSGL